MGDTPHLLLVDDERSIREPLAQYLTKQGFRVTQAGDAEAARARLTAYAIDLVILDIMMPGEDGLQSVPPHPRDRRRSRDPADRQERGDRPHRRAGNGRRRLCREAVFARASSPRASRSCCAAPRPAACASTRPTAASTAFAGWVLKSGERALVDREGVSVPLSTGEYNLLLALVARPRQVLTRDQLLDLTQGREAAGVRPRDRQPGQPPAPQDRGRPQESRADQDGLGRRLHARGGGDATCEAAPLAAQPGGADGAARRAGAVRRAGNQLRDPAAGPPRVTLRASDRPGGRADRRRGRTRQCRACLRAASRSHPQMPTSP